MTERLSDDEVAFHANATSPPDSMGRSVHSRALAREVRVWRNAERMDTYEHADGEPVYGEISFMTEPEAFEESDYDERTEVLHKTWALVSVESLWYGPDATEVDG